MSVIRAVAFLMVVGAFVGCAAADSGSGEQTAGGAVGQKVNDSQQNRSQKDPVVFPPAAGHFISDHRGRQVDLREYKGKIVVLNFWATWCPPCRYEIPHLVRLRNAYGEDEVAILGVSIDRGREGQVRQIVSRFVDEYRINYPVLIDSEYHLLRQFVQRNMAAVGVPMTFVIDRDGRLFSVHEGLPQTRSGQPDPGGVLDREIRQLLDVK